MTDAEFRQALAELDLTQSAFARLMHELGDPREVSTILRSISNWCRGFVAPPPEMDVVLGMLKQAMTLETAIRRVRSPERTEQ